MNKDKVYTLLVFCLSFTVVFGGWFLTKELLHSKEEEILSAKGQVVLESTKADGEENNPAVQEEFVPQALSEEQMAEVLTVWEAGGREILHEPMTGQMNMEQAIAAGREWIDMLSENRVLPTEVTEYPFRDTSAVLCTLDSSLPLEESLISYWKVTYAEGDVEIALMIHARSGQVWNANISMNEDKMLYGTCSDEEILAIAFPFLTSENAVTISENPTLCKVSEEGTVYATLKRDNILVKKEEPKARLLLNLTTDIE